MTAPNVEMIAASLRSCSLGMRRGRRGEMASPVTPPPHLEEASDESEGVTVELNSETALPSQWEQCLDMRTGKVYYTNWETGVRTTKDPRSAAAYQSNYYTSDEDDEEEDDIDDTSDDDSCPGVGEDEFDDTADSTSISSTLSSVSPPEASVSTAESRTGSSHVSGHGCGQILVAAGCKSCFMYFMVPKRVDACPKCGGGLLHLGGDVCV